MTNWEDEWDATVSPLTTLPGSGANKRDEVTTRNGRAWRRDEPRVVAADGFGATLRAARLAAGLSQAALASRIEVNHSTIAYWEMGKKHPTRDYAQRLTGVLGDEVMIQAGYLPDGYTAVKSEEAQRHPTT